VERAALVALALALGGCASIRVESSGAVSIQPGLRNLAVCFDDVTGKLESVIAYKQSRTFAGQNVILGAFAGGIIGGGVGAGVGGLAGIVSELMDSATTLLGGEDPVPSCEPPLAPPLKPAEEALPPQVSRPPSEPRPEPPPRPYNELPLYGWAAFDCGGPMAPSWCEVR
jgi:hypothetical protein